MFEDEMRNASSQIWTLFKPYLKDNKLNDKEWDEIVKVADSVKYEFPEPYEESMRHDPSRWKSAMDYYRHGYVYLVLQTIEKYQKGLK